MKICRWMRSGYLDRILKADDASRSFMDETLPPSANKLDNLPKWAVECCLKLEYFPSWLRSALNQKKMDKADSAWKKKLFFVGSALDPGRRLPKGTIVREVASLWEEWVERLGRLRCEEVVVDENTGEIKFDACGPWQKIVAGNVTKVRHRWIGIEVILDSGREWEIINQHCEATGSVTDNAGTTTNLLRMFKSRFPCRFDYSAPLAPSASAKRPHGDGGASSKASASDSPSHGSPAGGVCVAGLEGSFDGLKVDEIDSIIANLAATKRRRLDGGEPTGQESSKKATESTSDRSDLASAAAEIADAMRKEGPQPRLSIEDIESLEAIGG